MECNKLKCRTGVDRCNLWFAPSRRLATKSASAKAERISQDIERQCEPDVKPDEQALFAAMHACAYRVSKCTCCQTSQAGECVEWAPRWKRIREHIVKMNQGLAFAALERFRPARFDSDLRSEALFALLRAVDRFNPWQGFRFSTYATNSIMRALVNRSRQEHKYRSRFPVQHDGSQEHPVTRADRDGLPLDRLRNVLTGNLAGLTAQEMFVVKQRFPAEGGRQRMLREVSASMGLSKERIRQIQNEALRKIRKTLDCDPFLT